MYERLHDPGNNGRLLLKVEPKDFTIGKTNNNKLWESHWFNKTDALPMHNTKRTTPQQVNVPKYNIHVRLTFNQYQHAYLWSLANPFGATLSSSSIPNIFCRSPSGCGLASPKNSTNSGVEMMVRNRREFRWILDLDKDLRKWNQWWKLERRFFTWWLQARSSGDTRSQLLT